MPSPPQPQLVIVGDHPGDIQDRPGLTGGGMVMVLMMGVAYLRVQLKRVA